MAKQKYFQDHGDHIRTVLEPTDFVSDVLPSIGGWIPCASAKAPITTKPKTDFIGLEQSKEDLTFLGLLACSPRQNTVAAAYPLAKGAKIKATITDVFVWKTGVEAYIWASVDDEFDFVFFATDFFCNKDKYSKGAVLDIELAAMGVEIMPGHEDITIDPEHAMKFYDDMDGGPELDENGNVAPLVMSCSELVALLPSSDECPDIYTFHSPLLSMEKLSVFGKEFCKANIVISHEPDDIEIPLYFDKALCPEIEGKDTILGVLWLQGHIEDAFEPWEEYND